MNENATLHGEAAAMGQNDLVMIYTFSVLSEILCISLRLLCRNSALTTAQMSSCDESDTSSFILTHCAVCIQQ